MPVCGVKSAIDDMVLLVGISGKLGAGKDTVKDLIIELDGREWTTLRFADRLKAVVSSLTATRLEDNYTREGKQLKPAGFDQSLGTLQQLVGMALRTHVDPDVWVKVTLAEVISAMEGDGDRRYVVSDVRFKNEARYIQELGGILIRVNGDPAGVRAQDGRDLNHVSETDLDDYGAFDVVIENTGTLEELSELVKQVVLTRLQ